MVVGFLLLITPLALVCAPVALPVSALLDHRRQKRLHRDALQTLAEIDSVWAIGAAAPLLHAPSLATRDEAAFLIANLIPELTEAQYGAFPSDTVPHLARAFAGASPDLALRLLFALAKIGDSRALTAVQRLALEGETEAIRAEAQRILPILEARAQQENSAQNLLRPTQAPAASPQELLRPASEGSERPEELLRPESPETA
jgi:hypothetical protein